ncbi:MAG: 5-formyltetrahydrofolate cyclo-ligase [Thermoguttaceae bacterium]|nr:5-formyltetrahydrofolate cyclo-ligase [Thermoguttaceae bacterium]
MSVVDQKKQMRATVRAKIKNALATLYTDRDATARSFATQLFSISEVRAAHTIMAYIDLPDEVPVSKLMSDFFFRLGPTEQLSPVALRKVVVPYCQGKELGLFRFSTPDSPETTDLVLKKELTQGQFGILEPHMSLRNDPGHVVELSEIDVVLVPGIAFDLVGGRLGRGAGFYDRFLSRLSKHATLIALALGEQLVEAVPMEEHDRRVNYLVKTRGVHKIQ